MKKTLISALTTALVVGAASTTFAAANPFSDVPADHWAYDAVSQLAADGVIEGYGDTTFQGDKNITRYEMAQMIAKAMAKQDVPATDKALIDKLAAEFADELNNLGVRVSNLEKHADMVKWNGKIEYTYESDRSNYNIHDASYDSDDPTTRKKESSKSNLNQLLFRLEPTAEVNDHWDVHARLDAKTYMDKDAGNGDESVKLKRVWAQGNYKNFTVKAGKFAPIDNDSIMDTEFSGAEVAFGNDVTFTLGAGRWSGVKGEDWTDANGNTVVGDKAANYQYAGIGYAKDKFAAGVDYHHLGLDKIYYPDNGKEKEKDKADIWIAKAAYRFDNVSALGGYYAQNSDADDYAKSASIEYDYKGAQQENAGTWGAWLAYRHLGTYATLASTFDVIKTGEKGWEVGGNYTVFKNVVGTLRYGNTKALADSDQKDTYLFGRVEFFF